MMRWPSWFRGSRQKLTDHTAAYSHLQGLFKENQKAGAAANHIAVEAGNLGNRILFLQATLDIQAGASSQQISEIGSIEADLVALKRRLRMK